MEFAQILQNLLDATDMSNYRLAQLLRCSQSTIGTWLTGKNEPSRAKLYSLADVFGVTVEQLRGESPIDYENLLTPPVNPSVGSAIPDEPEEAEDKYMREAKGNPLANAFFYSMRGATDEEWLEAIAHSAEVRRRRCQD